MQGVISWCSWVGTAFLIISYLLNPALRKFPKGLIMMTAMAANVLAGGMLLPTFAGHNQIWCGGQDQTVSGSYTIYVTESRTNVLISYSIEQLTVYSGGCSLQGAMLLFGFLSCTAWWVIIAFNVL